MPLVSTELQNNGTSSFPLNQNVATESISASSVMYIHMRLPFRSHWIMRNDREQAVLRCFLNPESLKSRNLSGTKSTQTSTVTTKDRRRPKFGGLSLKLTTL